MTSLSRSQPLSSPEGIGQSANAGFALPSRRCLGVTRGVTGSGLPRNIGSLISWCRLWWTVISAHFLHSLHLTSVPHEESMVGEQLKMLSYADYALAVGLRSTDATGAEAADSADRAREAIQVGLRAIEHAAGIALKVRANLELARRDSALAGLSFDSDTKAQLHTLPLGHEELFGGKLDEASKQAEE